MSAAEAEVLKGLLVAPQTSATGRYVRDGWQELRYVGDSLETFATVDREEHENRRWSRAVTLITQGPSGAFYRWGFDEALTETGEDEFYGGDLVEVTRHEELVPVVVWKEAK